ncbi:MAG: tetratricopeptide repeat protein [Chlorobium sp.]|nr:tetratricopeptide repeat protein [Chlorobium sp.]MCW8819346.1 tetratricopeptide repeat protein [Ignavibacteriaceae bacterium]
MEQYPLVETDKEAEKIDRLLEFFILHKNLIIAVTIAIVAIAGSLVYMRQQSQSAEEKANSLVSSASASAQIGNWQQAIDGDASLKGLREIVNEYGSTPSGNFAKILLGDSHLALGEIDSALESYRSYSGKIPDLAASAHAGAALCLSRKKELPEAAQLYEKASETATNQALKALYLSDAADTWLSLGELDKAVTLYKDVIKKYPGLAGAAKSEESLLALAGKTGNISE